MRKRKKKMNEIDYHRDRRERKKRMTKMRISYFSERVFSLGRYRRQKRRRKIHVVSGFGPSLETAKSRRNRGSVTKPKWSWLRLKRFSRLCPRRQSPKAGLRSREGGKGVNYR